MASKIISDNPAEGDDNLTKVIKVHTYSYADSDESKSKIRLSTEQVEQIMDICKSFENKADELINVLHQTQKMFGYLPAEVQEVIAHGLHVSSAHVYGVVTFYSYFTMTPKGKYPISVCTGTACYVRGAEKVLEEFKRELDISVGETTPDGLFSIDCLRCVGACGLAPVVLIGDKVHGRVAPESVKIILAGYRDQL